MIRLMIKRDTGYGPRNLASPKKFVANILCEKHNTDLHTADDTGRLVLTVIDERTGSRVVGPDGLGYNNYARASIGPDGTA